MTDLHDPLERHAGVPAHPAHPVRDGAIVDAAVPPSRGEHGRAADPADRAADPADRAADPADRAADGGGVDGGCAHAASVVIASYNRAPLLATLLDDLAAQRDTAFEVVIVDDGSSAPVSESVSLERPFPLRVIRQDNAGAGAARHTGIVAAVHQVIVVLDDDMAVGPDFVRAHLDAHRDGAEVVLGRIELPADGATMPLFERFHQRTLDRFIDGWRRGDDVLHGGALCTGNVSFRRDDYLRLGGFDSTLAWCEDRDLGIRLELDGRRFAFGDLARAVHRSDHDDLQRWRRRNVIYGESDATIAQKHPQAPNADPWSFLPALPAPVRPVMLAAALLPAAAGQLGGLSYRVGLFADRLRRPSLAEQAATLCYGLDYYRGVRAAHLTRRAVLASYRRWRRTHGASARAVASGSHVVAR